MNCYFFENNLFLLPQQHSFMSSHYISDIFRISEKMKYDFIFVNLNKKRIKNINQVVEILVRGEGWNIVFTFKTVAINYKPNNARFRIWRKKNSISRYSAISSSIQTRITEKKNCHRIHYQNGNKKPLELIFVLRKQHVQRTTHEPMLVDYSIVFYTYMLPLVTLFGFHLHEN